VSGIQLRKGNNMVQLVNNKNHKVVKRNGDIVDYNPEKLYKVILWACENSEVFADQLLEAIDIKIHNKIHITKLYDEVITTASNLISELYPFWEVVARNLYLLKLHKDIGVKRTEYPDYATIVENNVNTKLYNQVILDTLDIPELAKAINPEYDKLFTFGGLNLFVQKYCNRQKNQLLELPQHTYMRVAIQLMYKQGTTV
jgi:ribonucleoside-diphosphate reductase alpha chain